MKKLFSALVMACLCWGLVVGCGAQEENESTQNEVIASGDFNAESNQKKIIQGYCYEVPINWSENNSTDTISYFYPENGMLMVSYEEAEGVSITDEAFRKTYSENVASGFDNYELLDSSEITVAGQKAYREDVNFTSSDQEMSGTFVTFDYPGGIVSFMMGTYLPSDVDYSEDFEKILESVETITVDGIMNDLEEAGIPIEYRIIYTDENDPNGKDHDYLEKGNFADSRIEENYSEEEPLSGSIEVFATKEEAIERADYLESLSALDSFACRIISGSVLLRLNDNYTDDQIQEFADIIGGSIHSKSDSDFGDLQDSLNQSQEEETEITSYSGGMYKIGTDMPAGEYLLTSTGGYYEVTTDSTGSFDSIVTNDNYANRAYVTVQEGQYFTFDGTAVSVNEAPAFSASDGIYPEGMYLVGKDIPAGEYKISATGSGYYEVTSDSVGELDSIVTNENFDGDVYLTISEGQYLKLSRAQIITN